MEWYSFLSCTGGLIGTIDGTCMKSPRLGLWLCCRRCSAMRWHTASLQRVLSTEPPRKSEVKPGWVLQILFYAKLCFNKVILIPKWNKVFLSFSLEVLHHYWLLVPRKLDFSPVAFEFIDWEEAWVGFFLPLVFSSLPFPWVGEVSISVWRGGWALSIFVHRVECSVGAYCWVYRWLYRL